MKKLLVTLIVSLTFCGSIIAQHPETHWPGFNSDLLETQGALYASLMIEGEPVDINYPGWETMEVAAFVGTEPRMTGAFLTDEYVLEWGELFPTLNAEAVYYTTPGEVVNFKMFDHATGIQYDLCTALIWDGDGTPITIHTGEEHWEGFDDPDHPLMLNFVPSVNKDILGYTANTNDRYYLIASPVGAIDPQEVVGMTQGNFDLYYFDQAATDGLEWINYNQGAGNDPGFTELAQGKGYLYAHSTDTTLFFPGTGYSTNNGEFEVQLAYNESAKLKGWNLIGNPFAEPAELSMPYYRMNQNGTALNTELENTAIDPVEGVFVEVDAPGTATFTPQTRSGAQQAIANTNIKVIGDEGEIMDNAIIRFDGGATLGKFQLNANSTKVYIPQDGKDFAIVNAGELGEIPVNFKADHSGSYTLNFTNEEVSFGYLHLIDNLTGNDVDLLVEPSYRFEAQTSDYATRFKLVFATGSSVDGDSFGFINGMGNLCIFGIEGTATLQVIDLTGRILSSETFSGSYEKKLDVTPSVYLIRLINGDNVKVQKMVVK